MAGLITEGDGEELVASGEIGGGIWIDIVRTWEDWDGTMRMGGVVAAGRVVAGDIVAWNVVVGVRDGGQSEGRGEEQAGDGDQDGTRVHFEIVCADGRLVDIHCG